MNKLKQKILVLGLIALILLMIGCTQPSAQGGTGKTTGETLKSGAELENLSDLPNPALGETDYLDAIGAAGDTTNAIPTKPKTPTTGK
ncbi:MAG: hypothetical protein AB1467_05825 [Candidatus Diapherotrites archaeon]